MWPHLSFQRPTRKVPANSGWCSSAAGTAISSRKPNLSVPAPFCERQKLTIYSATKPKSIQNRLKSQNNTTKRPGQMFAGVCKLVEYKCKIIIIFNYKCNWDFLHLCMKKNHDNFAFINMSGKQYPTRGFPSHAHRICMKSYTMQVPKSGCNCEFYVATLGWTAGTRGTVFAVPFFCKSFYRSLITC